MIEAIDFNALANFGVLGMWTAFNILTIMRFQKKEDESWKEFKEIVKQNTAVLSSVSELMRNCNKK